MDIIWVIDDITIQLHSEVEEVADILRMCVVGEQEEANTEKKPRYSVYIIPNKGQNSISLMCIFNKDHSIMHRDNFPPCYCGAVLFNQVLPKIIMNEQGYLLFHASGIVANERLILFLGKSGSGKTSLVLKSVLSYGASYFSDDFTLYNVNTQKFIPFMRMLHIKQDTEKRFMLDGSGKKEFEKQENDGRVIKYKVFFPGEIKGLAHVCKNSAIYREVAFVDVCYLGNINQSIPEYIGIATDNKRFGILAQNCTNIKTAQADLVMGYRQMKEYAKFYTAMFQDENVFLKKLIDGLM